MSVDEGEVVYLDMPIVNEEGMAIAREWGMRKEWVLGEDVLWNGR